MIHRLGVVALVACGGGEGRAPVDPVPTGACLAPEEGWSQTVYENYGEPRTAVVSGTLGEVADGLPADGPCAERDYDSWVGSLDGLNPSHGVITDGDGVRWVVAFAQPGGSLADLEGPVSVDYSRLFGGFSPTVGHLILSDDTSWRAWLGLAGELDEVVAPDGVFLARGEDIDLERSDCGDWEDFATEVTVDGASGTVDVGQTADVGSATITVGAHELQVEGQGGRCPDWYVATARIGGYHR